LQQNPEGAGMSTVLTASEVGLALQTLPGWTGDGKSIVRVFQFGNFLEAIEFVNKIAVAAETANHHPDILINYNKVTLTLVSHDSGGVTRRDIGMAGKINEIAGS
jgi:4a-hydroxytetrahydrobiopterin dehydratase